MIWKHQRIENFDDEGSTAALKAIDVGQLRRTPPDERDVRIDELKEVVDSVGIIRTPSSSGGGYGGGGIDPNFGAFAIDIHGESHTIAESSSWEAVETDAQWLARQLDVPCRDETYG